MKYLLATVFILASAQAFAQSSCSDAYGLCLTPRGGGACDARCQSYCSGQKAGCMKTGNFKTRNHSRTGLQKQ